MNYQQHFGKAGSGESDRERRLFHSLTYSDSNDAENYFIRAPVLNDCLLKRAAVLNYSPDRKFVVAGECQLLNPMYFKSQALAHLNASFTVFTVHACPLQSISTPPPCPRS